MMSNQRGYSKSSMKLNFLKQYSSFACYIDLLLGLEP